MVRVLITPAPNGKLKVDFISPKNDKVVFNPILVDNTADAQRQMYFRNRDYIYQHIKNFLKYRKYALELSGYHKQVYAVEILMAKLDVFSDSSYQNLCRFIYNNEGNIMELAPGEHSKHFKNYKNFIEPILQFCRPIKHTLKEIEVGSREPA